MKTYKSERLKKLESDLQDLEEWLKLGLVPKKEIDKHKQEINDIKGKIEEERERIQFLKESGDIEELVPPKKQATRAAYTDMPTIPDIDMGDTAVGARETQYDVTEEHSEGESTYYEEREDEETQADKEEGTNLEEEEEEEESYFSDRARWRRGGIRDPDANEW